MGKCSRMPLVNALNFFLLRRCSFGCFLFDHIAFTGLDTYTLLGMIDSAYDYALGYLATWIQAFDCSLFRPYVLRCLVTLIPQLPRAKTHLNHLDGTASPLQRSKVLYSRLFDRFNVTLYSLRSFQAATPYIVLQACKLQRSRCRFLSFIRRTRPVTQRTDHHPSRWLRRAPTHTTPIGLLSCLQLQGGHFLGRMVTPEMNWFFAMSFLGLTRCWRLTYKDKSKTTHTDKTYRQDI